MREVTPKSLLLDVLRVSPRPVPVRDLVSVGELFGLEGNAVRVALTRLGQRELVTRSDGGYRLAPRTDTVSQLVDAWRLGDKRLRAWKGDWMCVHHPRGAGRAERRRSRQALDRLGFREALEGLWVRPDNLRQAREQTDADLRTLGLGADAPLFTGRDFAPARVAQWCDSLWNTAALDAACREAITDIEVSTARLPRQSTEEALVETFLVGGHGIRVLATDPLLPEEICDGSARRALCEAMVHYDRLGKRLWHRFLGVTSLESAPTHLGAS